MKIKMGIVSFFFCLMAFLGVLAIEDSQKPVPLPIDGAFSIQGKSSKSNEEIYKLIDEAFSQKNVIFSFSPHPVLADNARRS